jgi:galactokinase
MHTAEELAAIHIATYSTPDMPQLYRAPGRVNLIGEHTDYSGGFVMPAAIDFSSLIAISPRTDGRFLAHSIHFNEHVDFPLDQLLAARSNSWTDYPAGVLWALREKNIPIENGFSLTIAGDVPLGAGLSSSASIEVCTAFAVLGTLGIELPLTEIALLCQRAENAFVGANVGIMDQFVICCGKQDHAVMIDTRFLTYTLAPIPPQVRIVICNSMVSHSLADGGSYNTRRAEMEAGVHILQQHRPEILGLRDATLEDLARWGSEMKPESLRRCRHVITEDTRVLAAVQAFQDHDLARFGQLMSEAHISFRDDFEASCEEVDLLVTLANQQPGCFGARLTGGGFGGCTVNLVAADHVPAFTAAIREAYLAATGITAEIYTSRASEGAHAIHLPE